MNQGPQDKVPFRLEIVKRYPQRGPLHQYRLAAATKFYCCRCGQVKTSKLTVAIHGDWHFLLCNACYGRLLSIWEVKAGDLADEDRHAELIRLLQGLVGEAEVARARSFVLARDERSYRLSQTALTMLATAEAVAQGFTSIKATELDWSAAIIGLCKAVEIEATRLIGGALSAATAQADLSSDLSRREFSHMARFCASGEFIELGRLASFLKAASKSSLAEASPLVSALREVLSQWPHSDWLVANEGFASKVKELAKRYRNPAAHTALLNHSDFESCSDAVQGSSGLLWGLLVAVEPSHR